MQDLQHIKLSKQNDQTYDILFEIGEDINSTADPRIILIQMIVKLLMTTPGSDSFFPTAGGGFQQIVSRMPSNPGDADMIKLQVHSGVKDTDKYIRSFQSRDQNITNSGRLKKLSIDPDKEIAIIQSQGIMIVPLVIKTYDGQTTRFDAPFFSSGGLSEAE